MLAKGLVLQPRAARQIAVGDHHLDPVVAEDSKSPAGGVRRGVVGGNNHATDAGITNGVGARRRPAVVRTRLDRYVERRLAQVAIGGGADRLDLGVRGTRLAMESLPERLTVERDNSPNERIWAYSSPSLFGELDRAGKVAVIVVSGDGHVA